LDGLGSVSILLVLVGHLGYVHGSPWLKDLEHLGNLGVKYFFVISGFLITTLLLKKLESTGRISLKAFYLRRGLRIFRAFYSYWAVIYRSGCRAPSAGIRAICCMPGRTR
jgi:peptidoglycan/LPS O-acetylase OafA/YrhL